MMRSKKMMKIERMNKQVKIIFSMLLLLCAGSLFAQDEDKKPDPAIAEAKNFVAEGNEQFTEKEFSLAEASYRKAVAKDPANVSAKYNMGNNYYRNKKFDESLQRYLQAAQVAQTKAEKHKAFHNLGNAYFQQKDFKQAVEAYKNALRNDPTDDETRYNLALAKKEEEKNGGGGGDDQNQDQDKNKDENKDQNNEGDGDQKENEDGKPKENDEGEGDENEDKKDEGEDQQDKGKPKDEQGDNKKPEGDGDEKQQPQQPQQGQLSPQQVKNLLEAMKNEENKTQDKINAKKVKGAKVKTDKDW